MTEIEKGKESTLVLIVDVVYCIFQFLFPFYIYLQMCSSLRISVFNVSQIFFLLVLTMKVEGTTKSLVDEDVDIDAQTIRVGNERI